MNMNEEFDLLDTKVCTRCGVLVGDVAVHLNWHAALDEELAR